MKLKYKICFSIAILLAVSSWVIAIYYWGKLPSIIPTHFGISGQADDWANKSLFYVFLIPVLQSLILGLFIFTYYKPQYSDMPTTMWLMTLDNKHRDHAFDLIRTMIGGISIWIGVLFTYITYGMNNSALNTDSGLSSWFLFALIGSMMVWLVFWSIKVYRATKSAIKAMKSKK